MALRNCPGGPRLRFLAGRPPAIAAAPNNGLLPGPEETVDVLLSRMADAGLSPSDLIDLLASHSVAFQEKVDPVSAINTIPAGKRRPDVARNNRVSRSLLSILHLRF